MKKYDNFSKALKNLKECLKVEEPYSVVEQTGIVGLFQICFEQSWKLMKEVLENHGRFAVRTGSPREILQVGYKVGFVNDSSVWLLMLKKRNTSIHIYNEEEIDELIVFIRDSFIPAFTELEETLQEKLIEVDEW